MFYNVRGPAMTFDETLISVWRQALVDRLDSVELDGATYPVKRTSSRRFRQVDFQFGGKVLRGLEQNPNTKSRWAQLARKGARVMQFLSGGRYIAAVSDGKVTHYGR